MEREDEIKEEKREGDLGSGVTGLSDAGRDHLDESGARSPTVNTGHHFLMETAQERGFKCPLHTFLTPATRHSPPRN